MNLHWLKVRRWYAKRRARRQPLASPIAELLQRPLPAPVTKFEDTEFLCLDIETTGLDAASAEMLSVGWLLIRNGRAELASAETHIVKPQGEVGDSACIHGLTDTACESGRDCRDVVARIVSLLPGRVLVVHHAGLDKVLLDRLCHKFYGVPLLVPVVDTLELEHRRLRRRPEKRQSLRLGALRAAYGLPAYRAHDSLVDAIATAELLLAMVARHGSKGDIRLAEIVV